MIRAPRPPWPPEPAVFLDLDGTLIEIAQRPDEVTRSARLDALLVRLPAAMTNAVAIVSGRTVADLDRLLAPHRLPVAGIHGLERRRADGTVIRTPVALDWMQGAREAMDRFAATHPGLLLENKGASLALHYRNRPELENAVQQFVAELDLPVAAERLQGRKVIEVKPRQMNKGTAIRAYMSEPPFAGRTPVFAGDDVTDESGFAVVNELGGVSVKVGTGTTAANWSLPCVSDVLDWLTDAISGRQSSRGARTE
ncbi:MAG: trehalose-phosphatase [Rhodospirillaceae bacterium]|nr:trehalose-phosphatase [Rhodospirillaceae bacterium]